MQQPRGSRWMKVDATVHQDVGELFGVSSYSTLYFSVDGGNVPYTDERTKASAMKMARKKRFVHTTVHTKLRILLFGIPFNNTIHYVDQHITTGFGIHLAQPIFHKEWKEDMTLEEGKKLIEKALMILFYRDRSAINKIQVENITEDGVHISPPYALKTTWNLKAFRNPTTSAVGSW